MANSWDHGTFVLAAMPKRQMPVKFLTDSRKHIGDEPLTTDVAKAWKWSERTGPYRLMNRHPYLKGRFYPMAV